MDTETLETIETYVYPWAAPREDQKAWFHSLPLDEQRQMIRDAIEDGFNSGISEKSISDIRISAKRDLQNKPQG